MPTLTINGRKVTVGEEFLSLSPEEQDATVDEIARSIGPSYSDEIVPARQNLPAPTAGALSPEPATPPPLPAPSAGSGPAPEDMYERAAQRVRTGVMPPQGRPEGGITKALTSVPGMLYGEVERLNEAARRAFENPSPETVLPLAAETLPMTTPAARTYGAIRAARWADEMRETGKPPLPLAQEVTGVDIPGAAKTGQFGQLIGRAISSIPYTGGKLRARSERASEQLKAAGERAAELPTGELVPQEQAGMLVKRGIFQSVDDPRTLDPKLQGMLRGSDEDVIGTIVRMAGEAKTGADIRVLAKVRRAVPVEDQPAVQSALVHRLGRSRQTGEFEPRTWVSNYGNMSDRGKNILFGTRGSELRLHLDSIAEVSRMAPKWEQFLRERALTGTRVGVIPMLTAGLIGYAGGPLMVLATAVPLRVIGNALSKPRTAAPLARWSRSLDAVYRTGGSPAAIASFRIATNNLGSNLGIDLASRWQDFLTGGANEQPVE